MTFRKKNKKKDLSNALPLTIGNRIRMFRELRNLSQRELGEKCGFPPLTAATRIGQYEADKKDPREDILAVMSEALNIDENALYNRANLTLPKMFHILFDFRITVPAAQGAAFRAAELVRSVLVVADAFPVGAA